MRIALLLLLCCSCSTAPEARPDDSEPEQYLECKKRYDYYRCCPRDFETKRIVGECFNLPEDK